MEEISDSSGVKPQRYSNNAENEKSRNKWKPIMTKQMRKNDTITIIGSKTRTTCSNNRSRLLKRRKAKPIKIAICSSSNSSSLPPSPPHPSPPPSSASTLNPTCDYQQCHQYRHCTNLRPMQQKTNTSSVEASRFQPSFKTISRKWNRLGLVRRTHSPINMSSPVAKPFVERINSHCNFMSMGSNGMPIGNCLNLPLLGVVDSQQPAKKRKRCHSPKHGKRSRSKSPNNRTSKLDTANINANTANKKEDRIEPPMSAIKVKIVSPTLRGVKESSRFLRCGMFSFPTETMYALASFVPFKRRKELEQPNIDKANECQWDALNRVKLGHDYNNRVQQTRLDPPVLFIHRPDYASHYVSFSKPKTFVFKHQKQNKDDNSCSDSSQKSSEGGTDSSSGCSDKLTAVTFSESYEVLNRLTSSFWPGPVTIYAPVKQLGSKLSTTTRDSFESSDQNSGEDSRIMKDHSQTSCSSLSSLTSESSDEQPRTLSTNDCDNVETRPILPMSALLSKRDIFEYDNDDRDNDTPFFGIRCPSHPLARRVLDEVYNNSDLQKNAVVSSKKNRQRIPGAVLGYDASLNGSSSLTCRDVCVGLLSTPKTHSKVSDNSSRPTVYVMNGEIRKEIFSVSPGQFAKSSLISLAIDAPNRKVLLLRNKSHQNYIKEIGDCDIRVNDVRRALLCYQGKNDEPGSVKTKVITAVMNKWQVYEKEL